MGETTEISWTDHTFNPWWGCTKVSPACDHCYAETFSKRVGYGEGGTKFPIWGKDAQRRLFRDTHWAEPEKWNRAAEKSRTRKRVFCGSMCDVMEDAADLHEHRHRLYSLIQRTPWLDWLLLTKRPQNFRRFLPDAWLETPEPNIWGMTTVESKEYLWRAEALAETPFAVRGLSIEPLLGPLNIAPYLERGSIHWVIVGGESGPGARPMGLDWLRDIGDQCVAAGVAFHFKQWGEYGAPYYRSAYAPVSSPEPRSAYSWGGGTYSPRIGKKAAGRLLDGREWSEFPEPASR